MLSIIIPTRGRKESLKRCTDSIEKYTKNYELIIVEGEDGYNKSLNVGIKRAKGDYFVTLHDDHTVSQGWARVLAEVGSFRQGELGDKFDHWGGYWRPDGYCINPKEHPDYPAMWCISRKAMKKIGLFDEFYKDPGYQDVDLGFQIKKAGYKIKCLPGKVIHWVERTKPLSEENLKYLKEKWAC